MEVRIDLDVAGQEALALGRELYPWHFTVRQTEGSYSALSKGSVAVGTATLTIPKTENGIAAVLTSLADKERELREQLNAELAEIEQRRANLLAISYSPAPAPKGFFAHDIPDILDLSENWRDTTTCLKTGCGMMYNNTHWFWGDLHRADYGGSYYFNATSETGEDLTNIAVSIDSCVIKVFPRHNICRAGKVFIMDDVIFNNALRAFNDEWNQS